jgi:glycosyltransferase involved in cell wall biosynthesis
MMAAVDHAAAVPRALRIGFDGRVLASPAGGVRRYARELFGQLSGIDGLTLVAVGTPPAVDVPAGIETRRAGVSLPTNLGWMLTGLPRGARGANLDLFHAPSYTAPLGGTRPLVLTIHDVSYERHPEWYPYRRDPVRRAFYRHSARSADWILTDSEFSRDEICASYGLDPARIAVVPLAAAPAFEPGPVLPLPPGVTPPFVLHVGDLHPRRNLMMLARAAQRLRQNAQFRDLSLVLVGVDRGTGDELRHMSARAGGRRALIEFLVGAPEQTLLALYRSAAALVYPSRYEGFGLPLVEAMACGTPVIAAATSSIPEVVGGAAVLLDPDDEDAWTMHIAALIEDGPRAAALREAGVQRATAFSWRRTAEETARIYRCALEQRT